MYKFRLFFLILILGTLINGLALSYRLFIYSEGGEKIISVTNEAVMIDKFDDVILEKIDDSSRSYFQRETDRINMNIKSMQNGYSSILVETKKLALQNFIYWCISIAIFLIYVALTKESWGIKNKK